MQPSGRPLTLILLRLVLGFTLAPAAIVIGANASPSQASGEAGSAAAPANVSLEGVDWALVAYRSGGTLIELDDPRGPARLRFEEGRVAGSAGCNRLMGAYRLKADTLHFEPPMASTMMACPEPLMTQEQAVHAALTEVASYRLAGDRLELLDGNGHPLLRFAVLEPAALTGTRWHLSAYNNGKEAIVSVLAGTEITLELQEDGRLGGSDGCNRYMSGFTLEGDRLTIGPVATTRMACRGPQGAAEQAAAYAAALGTVIGYRIEGDELTLINAEGTSAALFRAESKGTAQGASDPGR